MATKAKTINLNDKDAIIKKAVDQAMMLEKVMAAKVLELKTAQDQINATWDAVKEAMIKHNVKSFKGEFGSITIAERTSFKTDMEKLSDEFKKLAPDTAKIGTYNALMGEPPEGAEAVTTQYLTKRLK